MFNSFTSTLGLYLVFWSSRCFIYFRAK